jgi:hypothetical protein
VIGNVMVYRHYAHVTATYVRSLEPMLAKEMKRVLDETSSSYRARVSSRQGPSLQRRPSVAHSEGMSRARKR